MSYIRVTNGFYRKKPIQNVVFRLIEGFQTNAKNISYVTVDGTETDGYPNSVFKVIVSDESCIQEVSHAALEAANDPMAGNPEESDEEALERIAERFAFLETLVVAANEGRIRGLIVSGPPGVGKSYEVEQLLRIGNVGDALAWDEDSNDEEDTRRTEIYKGHKKFQPRYKMIKGQMSAVMLFCELHKYSDRGEALVLDDCDGIFRDIDALNILKGALDTGDRRMLSYNKDSHILKEKGVPNFFEFKGTVIFITNIDFEGHIDKNPNSSLRPHLEAMMSRCHYLDLTMQSMRDRFLRVRYVHEQCNFLAKHGCDEEAANDVLSFIYENANKLREISLRMAIQLAEKRALAGEAGYDWKRMAAVMEFKRKYRGKK